jgi:Glycine zipper 2TM domain
MTKLLRVLLISPLLLASAVAPAMAQHRGSGAYYNGVRNGGHGGRYYDNRDRGYHNDYYNRDQGGIGPGKGALIGAAAGGLLGAAFSGSLKGTIVGGAAGAGIGAVVGQSAQDNRDNGYYRH